MFIPEIFRERNPENLFNTIEAFPLATLVLGNDGHLAAHPLPFTLHRESSHTYLRAHIPRANPLSQLSGSIETLLVFHGPQGYISPAWYASKGEHGRVVPTWNYAQVQVRGPLRVVDDPHWVRAQITALTEQQESRRDNPWRVGDAPADYIERLLASLVGLEVQVSTMEGKTKASQNQPAENQRSTLQALANEPESRALHAMMEQALEDQG